MVDDDDDRKIMYNVRVGPRVRRKLMWSNPQNITTLRIHIKIKFMKLLKV